MINRKFPRHGFDLDYLQEQNPMERYRIKKVITGDGTVWYCPQKKVLWVWWNMVEYPNPYGSVYWANAVIRTDFKDSQKDKVEYIEPDTSQTVPPDPNSPQRCYDTLIHAKD